MTMLVERPGTEGDSKSGELGDNAAAMAALASPDAAEPHWLLPDESETSVDIRTKGANVLDPVWTLPDAETPVDIRPRNANVIDLRQPELPATQAALERGDLGSRWTGTQEGRLPVIGNETSAPIPAEATQTDRDDKVRGIRARLRDLPSRSSKPVEAVPSTAREPENTAADNQAIIDGIQADINALTDKWDQQATQKELDDKKAEAAQQKQSMKHDKAEDLAYKEKELAERAEFNQPVDAAEAAFIAGVKNELSGARTLAELRDKAKALILPNGLVASADGKWFEPANNTREARLAMNLLDEARDALGERSMLRKTKDKATVINEAWAASGRESQERWDQKVEAERVAKEAADKRELADFEARLEDAQSFKDYVTEKQGEARKPFDARIKHLQDVELPRLEARRARRSGMGGDWIKGDKHTDAKIQEINDEIVGLQKRAQKAEKQAKKNAKQERRSISEEAHEKSDKALDLVEGNKPGHVNYNPKAGQDPDKSLVVADRIGMEVGKRVESNGLPFQVNQYKLDGVTMQRLVYKTNRADVVLVEEWDKDAGVLKRQTVMKGNDLLVRSSANDGLGRIRTAARRRNGGDRLVLNDARYAEAGMIKRFDSSSDSGDSGSYDLDDAVRYASRLNRSGIGGRGMYEMASDKYKTKNSKGFKKGFLAMLQDSLVQPKAKK